MTDELLDAASYAELKERRDGARAEGRYVGIGLASYVEGIKTFCTRHELGYVQARTDEPFEDLILGALRTGDVIQ